MILAAYFVIVSTICQKRQNVKSVNNHSLELYQKSTVCFANIDNHGDISFTHGVIRDVVKENCIPYIITENDDRLECWIFRK